MLNLASGFADRGFLADLVLASATGELVPFVPKTVRVIDLGVRNLRKTIVPLRRYLMQERPPALLAALNHANLAAMATGRLPGVATKTVISIHNALSPPIRDEAALKDRAVPRLLGVFHRWADEIVAVSHGVADDLAHTTGVPRDRITVIYNPVITPGLAAEAAAPSPHEWLDDPDHPVVLGVGRLTRQKNFPALIEAFEIVRRERNARLVILGEGPERPALEAQVRERGLRDDALLPGFVPNPHAYMARAAVFALSSDWEGLPTVLIESLATGTPVVATDCMSGPREILQDGKLGALVPVGDVGALAKALSRAITCGRASPPPDALLPFTSDVVLDQYEEVLGLRPTATLD
jgi:glycosyltransferase involved in cell wall biosynthesis